MKRIIFTVGFLFIVIFLTSCSTVKTNNNEVNKKNINNYINELIDKSLQIQYEAEKIILTDVFTVEFIEKIPATSNFYKKDLKPYKIISTNLHAKLEISIDNPIVSVRINDSKGDYIQVMHFVKNDGKYFIAEIEYDI